MTEHKPWENIPQTKMTTLVASDLYERVKKRFHYGQMSQLLRTFIISIDLIIKQGNIVDIIKYMHGKQKLTLPLKDDKDAANGSDKDS